MRLLLEEVKERLEELSGDDREKTVSVATAKLAFPTIEKLARDVEKKFPHIKVHVYCIKNEFFGEHITVSGLLTGGDIIAQLKDRELGEELLLPCTESR
jgi:NifB/MoaA-like Fe-S oxidoreductase